MIRVGFLTETLKIGWGVSLVVDQKAKRLQERGYEVTVFCNEADKCFYDGNYKIEILGHSLTVFPWKREWEVVKQQDKLSELDLIIPESYPYYSLAFWLNLPSIIVVHGMIPLDFRKKIREKIFYGYMKLTEPLYFRSGGAIVTISDFLKSSLPSSIRGKTHTIYHGADHYSSAKPEESRLIRSKLGIGDEAILALFVGRLNPDKIKDQSLQGLIKANNELKKKLDNFHFLMVGQGSEEDQARLEVHGIKTCIQVPPRAMGAIYAAADLYVTASRWEGFDLPVVEAQYFGKPVVAFKIGSHREVVKDGQTGLLVNSFNEFLLAIQTLIQNEQLREELGENARNYAKKFTWKKTVNCYDNLIHEVLKSSNGES